MCDWVDEELAKNSTDRLYIEYKGFFSNHLSHALIALGRLDADREYVEQHVQHHLDKLEGSQGPTAIKQQGNKGEGIQDLLGQRKGFYLIKKYYEDLLENKYNNVLENFIQEEFHKLYLGTGGSALHGLIHTGYGLSQKSPFVVCEGLSYLHHSSTPFVFSSPHPASTLGQGSCTLPQVLANIREDKDLRDFMLQEAEEEWVKMKGQDGFPNRMLALVTKRGDQLVKYANMVRAPEEAIKTESSLAAWILESSILLYQTSTTTNDFFLLHGVTATWALNNILQVFKDKSQILEILQVHLCLLLAVYLARDAPQLNMDLADTEESRSMTDKDIRERVLALPPQTDEHVYKMVQVCLETCQAKSDDEKLGRLCRAAAITAIKYPLKIFL